MVEQADREMVEVARIAFCECARTAAATLANLEYQLRDDGLSIDQAIDPKRLKKVMTDVLETAGALRFSEALALMRRGY